MNSNKGHYRTLCICEVYHSLLFCRKTLVFEVFLWAGTINRIPSLAPVRQAAWRHTGQQISQNDHRTLTLRKEESVTMDKSERPQSAPPTAKPEFVISEFEQAAETFRTQFSLLTQAMTVLVLADVTLIGYAISTQISGIIVIGAIFPIMILYIAFSVDRLMLPIVYTAISLEHKYGGGNTDWLASTFLSMVTPSENVDKLKAISVIQDPKERIRKLRTLKTPLVFGAQGTTCIVIALVALGQVVAPIVLTLAFKWRLI